MVLSRRLIVTLALLALIATTPGCIDRFTGTVVSMNLAAQVKVNKPGEHYELFVTIHGSIYSVKKFVATFVEKKGFQEPQVLDFYSGLKVGVLTHLSPNLVTESGVEFSVPARLKDATEAFIVIKKDTDSSPGPGDNIFVFGKFGDFENGVIRARMRPLNSQDVNTPAWASITLIVAEDNKQF